MRTDSGVKGAVLLQAILLVVMLCGCGGGKAPAQSAPVQAAPFASPLPPVSALQSGRQARPGAAAVRRSSTLNEAAVVRDGKDFRSDLASQNVVPFGLSADYSSSFNAQQGLSGLAFAIYSFDTPDPARQPIVRLIWKTAAPADKNVWIAAANFSTGVWDWQQPVRESSGGVTRHKLTLSAWNNYLSPLDGSVFVAVVLTGTESVSLKRLRAGDTFLYDSLLDGPPRLSPEAGLAGQYTLFYDFSNTSIAGSVTTSVEVDYDGDGVFDSSGPVGSHLYGDAGNFNFSVVFSNDEGLSDALVQTVHALGFSWEMQQLAFPAGEYSSYSKPAAGVIGGRPAVALYAQRNTIQGGNPVTLYEVQYYIAADWQAYIWAGPFIASSNSVAPVLHMGGLLDCGGAPGIFYHDAVGQLKYLHGDSAEPASWTDEWIDGNLPANSDVSAALINGHPAVAYIAGPTSDRPYYYWSSTVGGSDWWGGDVGGDPVAREISLKQGAVGPLLACRASDLTRQMIKWTLSGPGADAGGITSFQSIPITAQGGVGLDVAGTHPRYVFSGGNFGLWLLTSVDSPPPYIYNNLLLDGDVTSCNLFTSLLGKDLFCIYYDQYFNEPPFLETRDLRYAIVTLPPTPGDPGTIISPYTIDAAGDVGNNASAVICGGRPVVAYEDVTNHSVKFAMLN